LISPRWVTFSLCENESCPLPARWKPYHYTTNTRK